MHIVTHTNHTQNIFYICKIFWKNVVDHIRSLCCAWLRMETEFPNFPFVWRFVKPWHWPLPIRISHSTEPLMGLEPYSIPSLPGFLEFLITAPLLYPSAKNTSMAKQADLLPYTTEHYFVVQTFAFTARKDRDVRMWENQDVQKTKASKEATD